MPLHYAAWNDADETAQLLIAQGAEINAKTDWALTPLHMRRRKMLLKQPNSVDPQGADVNAKTDQDRTPHTMRLECD